MQHAFTLDLEGLTLPSEKLQGTRLLVVFMDELRDMELDSSAGVEIVWVSQADLDAHPKTQPPADYVQLGEDLEDSYGDILIYPPEEDEEFEDDSSFIDAKPRWPEDAREAQTLPEGAFVMQLQGSDLEFGHALCSMMIFEGGAYVVRNHPDEDDDPMPWPEALAATKELVVVDESPEEGSLNYVGGLPPIAAECWPRMVHVLTVEPYPEDEDDDVIAISVFARADTVFGTRLFKGDDRDMDAIETVFITQDDLDDLDDLDEDERPTAREGVTVLPAKKIERRAVDGMSVHELRTRSLAGPRAIWTDPEDPEAGEEHVYAQLRHDLFPNAPGPGTLYLSDTWIPDPNTRQIEQVESYRPTGSLYFSETMGAVLVGWKVPLEQPAAPVELEALEQAIDAALAERAWGGRTKMYVLGDTHGGVNRESVRHVFVGKSAMRAFADDLEPAGFHASDIDEIREGLPALDAAFWNEVREAFPRVGQIEAQVQVVLGCWGPLPRATVCYGIACDDASKAQASFFCNVSMEQEPAQAGVDGVSIVGTEWDDAEPFDVEAKAVTEAQASSPEGAQFYLVCRYD